MVDQPPPSASTGDDRPDRRTPGIGDLFWLGTGCAICVIGAGALGYWLDVTFHTLPWCTFGGLAFGVVSAVMLAVSQVRKFL
jgi:hypothetical protein